MILKIELSDGETKLLSAGFPLMENAYDIDAFWEFLRRYVANNIEVSKK